MHAEGRILCTPQHARDCPRCLDGLEPGRAHISTILAAQTRGLTNSQPNLEFSPGGSFRRDRIAAAKFNRRDTVSHLIGVKQVWSKTRVN